jgi:DNA-binding LacI/PurR family transcriptional regulator
MAAEATRRLVASTDRPGNDEEAVITVPYELVLRGSTAVCR